MYGRANEGLDEPFTKNLVSPLVYLQQPLRNSAFDSEKKNITMAEQYLRQERFGDNVRMFGGN